MSNSRHHRTKRGCQHPHWACFYSVHLQSKVCRRCGKVVKPGAREGRCTSCDTKLHVDGGYGGSDLCGPCCIGAAETLNEMGETW